MPFVVYVDRRGFKQIREVAAGTMPNDYHCGVVIGPPDLSTVGLSLMKTKALNNLLVDAMLIEYVDLRGNRPVLMAILKKFVNDKKDLRGLRDKVLAIYQQAYYPEIFEGVE